MSTPEPSRIVVTVLPDGSVAAETHGIEGAACLDYIELLENLLEATVTTSDYTADYYVQPSTEQAWTNEEVRGGLGT